MVYGPDFVAHSVLEESTVDYEDHVLQVRCNFYMGFDKGLGSQWYINGKLREVFRSPGVCGFTRPGIGHIWCLDQMS